VEVEAMREKGSEKHWRENNFVHDYAPDDLS
jgi:hypothetical protein